ncbi:MAG: hypothetical protein GX456_03575 [Verrucomicrobia bacterium]|nr:hypothetical protein [Verrucomicrobiota bacterium]
MGIGKREALGVRQLAAALFLCPNNVSVPISASEGYPHRLRQPPIGTRDDLRPPPQSRGKTQILSLSLYLGPHPDNEPVTLFTSLLDLPGWQAGCTKSGHLPRHSIAKGRSGRGGGTF